MSRHRKKRSHGKWIVILVEGATESAFKPILNEFLKPKLAGRMPKLNFQRLDGSIPAKEELRRKVRRYLDEGADAIIALTDVYTNGKGFRDAADAKAQMRRWVGAESRFYPHTTQYDFEAWLLPFETTIENLVGRKLPFPTHTPESINHGNPPAHRLEELFKRSKRLGYSKTRDAKIILEKNQVNLLITINACPELKSFINSILTICGADEELTP